MASGNAIPIILDTDPGVDDAVAILLALASPGELELLCLTAVAGNVPLDLTAPNGRRVCALAGRPEIPVYAGAARPLDRQGHTATHVHGDNGLGGLELPLPAGAIGEDAVGQMIGLLRARPDEITLCAVGPLSNLALAERQSPGVLKLAKRIVVMGGASDRGNVTPFAEFNFYVDPLAAAEVFASGAELVMFGLNLTRQAPVTAERMKRIGAIGTVAAAACHRMMADYRHGEPLLHDVCVIVWLLAPELFDGQRARVSIDAGKGETAGQSLVEFDVPDANALVMEKADAQGMFALLYERLGRLP